MAFKRTIVLAAVCCLWPAQIGIGQPDANPNRGRSYAGDPFSISEGSSFAASRTSRSRTGSPIDPGLLERDFEEALSVIAENHVAGTGLSQTRLTEDAIRTMLKTLDPHSNYYDKDQFAELLGEHESEYTGTGSSIAGFRRNGRISTYVISSLPGSPAAKAGLRFGDKIIAVDSKSTDGLLPDEIRNMVRGKRGTTVTITVEKPGTKDRFTLAIKREVIHETSVPQGFLLAGRTGYIDLTNGFSNTTFAELEKALEDLRRQGMASLILDLRGNGGGILEQAVRVAEKFLPQGSTIVSQRGRYSDDERTWRAKRATFETLPLVLLVDETTASASEVLAGALQDNDRALILGRRTFGKGLVQTVLNLPEGSGLTLTAARYYTPTGRSIQRDYAETGIYDYFNHRLGESAIGKPVVAAKTPTNRIVYGGDGIAPDEELSSIALTDRQIELLDPLFFFALEADEHVLSSKDQKPGNDERLFNAFAEFVGRDREWSRLYSSVSKEADFIRRMLAYYLTLRLSGVQAASRASVEADPQVRRAVLAVPRAASLFAAAEKARKAGRKQKSSLSLVLNEQR